MGGTTRVFVFLLGVVGGNLGVDGKSVGFGCKTLGFDDLRTFTTRSGVVSMFKSHAVRGSPRRPGWRGSTMPKVQSIGLDALHYITRFREAQRKNIAEKELVAMLKKAIWAADKAGIRKTALDMLTKALHPSQGLKPTLSLFHAALQSIPAKEKGSAGKIRMLMSLIKTADLQPSNKTYTLALRNLGANGEWELAIDLLRNYENLDLNAGEQSLDMNKKYKFMRHFSVHVLSLAMQSLQKGRQWERVVDFMEEISNSGIEQDSMMYTAWAAAASHSSKPGRALTVLNKATHSGVRRSLSLFHAAIHACSRRQWWEKATSLFYLTKKSNFTLTPVTYTTLMSSFVPQGKWAKAVKFLYEMERTGDLTNDTRTIAAANVAMRACVRGKAWSRALRIASRWISKYHLRPETQTYDTALRAHKIAALWEEALDLFNKYPDMGVNRSVETYICLSDALASAEKWRRALTVLESYPEQSGFITSKKILALGKLGKWASALEAFDGIYSNPDEKWSEKERAITNVISALAHSRQNSRALKLFWELYRENESLMPIQAFASALQACIRTGMWQHALELKREVTKNSKSSQEKKTQLRRFGLLSQMTDSYATTLVVAGRWNHALNFLKGAKGPMNQRRYNISVVCTAKCAQWEDALNLLWERDHQIRAQAKRVERRAEEIRRRSRKTKPRAIGETREGINRLYVPSTFPKRDRRGPVRFDGKSFDPSEAPGERWLRSAVRRSEKSRNRMLEKQKQNQSEDGGIDSSDALKGRS